MANEPQYGFPIDTPQWGLADPVQTRPQYVVQERTLPGYPTPQENYTQAVNARTVIPVREQPQTQVQQKMSGNTHFHPYAGQVLSYPDKNPHMIYGDLFDVTAPYVNALIPWLEMGMRMARDGGGASGTTTVKKDTKQTSKTNDVALPPEGQTSRYIVMPDVNALDAIPNTDVALPPEGQLAATTQAAATPASTGEVENTSPYDTSTMAKGAAIGTGVMGGKVLFDWLHSPAPITIKSPLRALPAGTIPQPAGSPVLSLPMGAIPQPAGSPVLSLPMGAIPQPAGSPQLALPAGAIPMPPASTPATTSPTVAQTARTATVIPTAATTSTTTKMTPLQYINKSRSIAAEAAAKAAGVPKNAAQEAQKWTNESRRIAEYNKWLQQSRAIASGALSRATNALRPIANPWTQLGIGALGLGAEFLAPSEVEARALLNAAVRDYNKQAYVQLINQPNAQVRSDGSVYDASSAIPRWVYADGSEQSAW